MDTVLLKALMYSRVVLLVSSVVGQLPSPTTLQPPLDYRVAKVPTSITIPANTTIKMFTRKEPGDMFYLFSCHCRSSSVLMHEYEYTEVFEAVNSTAPALIKWDPNALLPLLRGLLRRPPLANATLEPAVFLTNPHAWAVEVLALARRYTASDPVPGWCTTWDGVVPKPFLSLDWNSATIRLNFSRASLLGDDLKCNEKAKFEYEVYHRYLVESTSADVLDADFARTLRNFTTIEDIKVTGTRVASLGRHMDRLVFASYPPTGSLYAVIVHYQNANATGTALYGVGHTYGCTLSPSTGLCADDAAHVVTNIVCGLAVFIGLMMAFAGHRLFITSQFLFGFYAGSFVGFILLNISNSWTFLLNCTLTTVCGLVGAALSTLLWLTLGTPVLSTFLPTLEIGVFVASILMFTPPLNVASLTEDLYYWLVFLCIVLAVPGILLAFTQKASILSCVFLGTYTTILPIDFFLGTNLRYISINVMRRATNREFGEAVILPPLQTSDLALVACWLGLAIAALVTQLLVERGRPAFPSPPCQLLSWGSGAVDLLDNGLGDRAPLVEGEVAVAVAEPVASPVMGYMPSYSSSRTSDSRTSSPRTSNSSRRPAGGQLARNRDIFKPPSPAPPRKAGGNSLPAYS